MNIRLQIIVAIILIIALCVIVNMIRKKRLELRYALAWLIVGVGTLVLDCFPILTTELAELIGVASPINMLFFLGFCFSLLIIFVLTVAISRTAQPQAARIRQKSKRNCGRSFRRKKAVISATGW